MIPSAQSREESLVNLAREEVFRLLEEFPPDLRRRLDPIPITFEDRPNSDLIRGGIDGDRTLGLFTGIPYPNALAISQRLPPQIILFIGNIRRYSGGSKADFIAQVRKTLLHEIGHYLGLGEGDLRRRGLG